jgi:ribosomal-protein-alanine N-acetyltransferase
MKPIETDRLTIRNFKIEDSPALEEMIVQYEASEYARYDQQWPTTHEEIVRVTEWFASGDTFMAVCLHDTDHFIGFVALNPEEIEDMVAYNLGYIFNFDFHGHGYATEACAALLRYAFNQLNADKVITGTAATNQPSCRLLNRLGFKKISEQAVSLRTTPDGKPIEFQAYNFERSCEG